MSLKLHFAALSLGASVDQQTGNLSVFDVIEEVKTHIVPIHLQSLVISLAMEKTTSAEVKGKLFIHLITPDGSQNMVGSGDMGVPSEQKRMKAVFRFGGFPVSAYGVHRLVVSWVNQSGVKEGEAVLDFDVVQVTQVAQGMASSEKPPLSH